MTRWHCILCRRHGEHVLFVWAAVPYIITHIRTDVRPVNRHVVNWFLMMMMMCCCFHVKRSSNVGEHRLWTSQSDIDERGWCGLRQDGACGGPLRSDCSWHCRRYSCLCLAMDQPSPDVPCQHHHLQPRMCWHSCHLFCLRHAGTCASTSVSRAIFLIFNYTMYIKIAAMLHFYITLTNVKRYS